MAGDPFAVVNNRLYTTRYCSNPNKQAARDYQFAFEESETIKNLEEKLFEGKKEEIIQQVNSRAFERYSRSTNKIRRLDQSRLRSFNQFGIEKFLIVDVADKYLKEFTNLDGSELDLDFEFNPPTVDFQKIVGDGSIFSRMLSNKGIFVFGRKVYTLKPGNSTKIGFRRFDFEERCSLDQLINQYGRELNSEINKQLDNSVNDFSDYYEVLENQVGRIEKIEQLIRQRRRDVFSFTKRGNNYSIFIDVPPFIMEKDGSYYQYGSNKIKLRLIYENGLLQVLGKPDVARRPYNHPFVYDTSEKGLCYGSFNFGEFNTSFHRAYSLNKISLSKDIAGMLSEGVNLLTRSYIGKYGLGGKTPVNYIYNGDNKISGRELENAISRGIKVYHQDAGS